MKNIRAPRKMPSLTEKEHRRWLRQIWRGPEIDCWIWTGSRTLGGYGQMRLAGDRTKYMAHRIGFSWYRKEIRAGGILMHSCDNPSCVNPWHLKVGTCLRNTWDKIEKGRHRGCVEVLSECPF